MTFDGGQFDYNDRYGIKPSKSWIKYAIGFALIGGIWIAWAGLHHAQPLVRSELISFSTQDPRKPVIRYFIQRDNVKNVIICTLTARDYEKNIVGQVQDSIEAGESFVERSVTIPTRAYAVNAGISGCRVL
jgi:hypothetical protein